MDAYGKSNDYIHRHITAFVSTIVVVLIVLCLIVFYLWKKVVKEGFDDGPHSLYALTSGGSVARHYTELSDAAHDAQYLPLKQYTEESAPFSSGHTYSTSEDALRGALFGAGMERYGDRGYSIGDPINNIDARNMALAGATRSVKEGWTGSDPRLSGVEWNYPAGYNYMESNFLRRPEGMVNQPKSEESLFSVVHPGL